MELLRKIAKRNVERLLNGGSTKFELLHKFIDSYDRCSKVSGTDHLLFEYMLNEIGYVKCESGGWSLNSEK